MLPTNEQIALWIDPERAREGWWMLVCPNCGINAEVGFKSNTVICGFGLDGHGCGHVLQQPNPRGQLVPSEEDYTGPDFTLPGPCAEFVEPMLDKHDVWRVRGGHWTAIWFNAEAYFKETAAIRDTNHQHACILALAEVMKNGN